MATFLAIYSKKKSIDDTAFEKVVHDFSIGGKRSVVSIKHPYFSLYVANKFERFINKTENSISFVSGYISYSELGEIPNNESTNLVDYYIGKNDDDYIKKLEGAFATIHYDIRLNQLTILNDKFGVMPMFIYEDKNYIIASNEYHPLAFVNNKLDYDAIAEFLTFGVTLGNKTFYRHIKNLNPASVIKIKNNDRIERVYWTPETHHNKNFNKEKASKDLYDVFNEVNKEYIAANIIDQCLLTAGADSRLIVATLPKEQLSKIDFYTSNLSYINSTDDKDVVGAVALSKKFNLNHTVAKISFYENDFNESYFDKDREIRDKHLYGGWHGGEFLGGYSQLFAPINKELLYSDIDKIYKSIFNWKFRFKVKKHPFKSYLEEKAADKSNLIFQIHQMTRSFFTDIYGGTRGHWVQPFQLMNHGFSPFWDSRILHMISQIPEEQLKNYEFYNEVFKHCHSEFTEIPSNSSLTNLPNSVLPKMEMGIEPKHHLPQTHKNAYTKCLNSNQTWSKKLYNKDKLLSILKDESHNITKRWLDFEIWHSRYFTK